MAVSNWKELCPLEGEEPATTANDPAAGDSSKRTLVWRDRSLALNFLFGLRRWKVSTKELFALVLEDYHFADSVRAADHISRDLEQERTHLKPLRYAHPCRAIALLASDSLVPGLPSRPRQKLAAFVHLWVLYFYTSEKEKRFVGRFLDLLKRDGLHEEVKDIQLRIWNACQEQDKLQAIQRLTPKRRPLPPAGTLTSSSPVFAALVACDDNALYHLPTPRVGDERWWH